MFTYLKIKEIIGEANPNYRTFHDFTEKIFLNTLESLCYRGVSKMVTIDMANVEREKSFSEPNISLKKAVIHCHAPIFEAIIKFTSETDVTSAENAARKLNELIRSCPKADTFLREYVYLSELKVRDKLAILFYIAMLAASDVFNSKMSLPQNITEEILKNTIYKLIPSAEYPSDQELLKQLCEECRTIPELEKYIMGHVYSCGSVKKIYPAFHAGESFFKLFSITDEQREQLRTTPFPAAEATIHKLLADQNVKHILELMLFFPDYQIEMEVIREFGADYVSALIMLDASGILKTVSPGHLYRPYYGWLFYLNELHALINRNALYYAEEFPVLPKLTELNRTDLLRTALNRLDFSEAFPVKKALEIVIG